MNLELVGQFTGPNWNMGMFIHLADRFIGYSKLIGYSQDASYPTLFDALQVTNNLPLVVEMNQWLQG